MGCQIFISYKREGGEYLAHNLYRKLTGDGYRVFLDARTLEKCNYDEEIKNYISECQDFIVVLSKGAMDKCNDPEDWVRKEVDHAITCGCNIIPVFQNGFVYPNQMPESFEKINFKTINGVNFPAEFFDAAYHKLVVDFLQSTLDDAGRENEEKIKKKADKGDALMMNEYAIKNETGTANTFENLSEAYKYYCSAAGSRLPAAYYNLGDIFEKCSDDPMLSDEYGIDMSDCNTDDVFFWFQTLAAENYKLAGEYAPALYRLGVIAEKNKELEEAFEYYSSSANKGYPPAQNAVGFFYQYGLSEKTEGTDRERYSKAEEFYKLAAKNGLTAAIYNRARVWELDGQYNENNLVMAYKNAFFGTPCIPQAAFSLAKFYENKKQDMKNAKYYYQLALESGFFRAEKELSRIEKKIVSSR